MEAPTNQHYVPQFILRNFATGRSKQIHVFDKATRKSFKTAIRNVAAEHGFYDFGVDGASVSLDPMLQKIEDRTSEPIRQIVHARNLKGLTDDDYATVAWFVTVQMLRTNAQRRQLKDLNDKFRDAIVARGGDPNNVEGFEDLDEERARGEAIRTIPLLARDLAPHFLAKTWALFSTSHERPFYISDNPITLQNTANQDPTRGTLGLAVPGIEIYFPLSPTLCIGFLCPTIDAMLREGHNTVGTSGRSVFEKWIGALNGETTLSLEDENVVNLNSLQVINAERHVYSGSSNFRLASEMLDSNPELKNGLRFQMA